MLTLEQQAALLPIYSGHNFAISGQAGTGKTFLLKELWRGLRERQMRVSFLCTTGMGCLQFLEVGAQTVHREFGLDLGIMKDIMMLKSAIYTYHPVIIVIILTVCIISRRISCCQLGDTDIESGCIFQNTSLNCDHVPTRIPSFVQKVFLHNINIEADSMEFDSVTWKNITSLDIRSDAGAFFQKGNQSIFKDLKNLRALGIHGDKLKWLNKELLNNLPFLKTLDFSENPVLSLDEIIKVFSVNTSLQKVENIYLDNINSAVFHLPNKLNKTFFELFKDKRVKSLNLHGFGILTIDFHSMRINMCHSLEVLNVSNVIYIPAPEETDILNLSPCPSLKTFDISESKMGHLQARYKSKSVFKFYGNISGFPRLEDIYLNNLNPGDSSTDFILNHHQLKCSSCSAVKALKLYLKNNNLKHLNLSCDSSCNPLKVSKIDLSSNGLRYLSPGLLAASDTLEEINLNNNNLHFMEHLGDFQQLFTTFLKLRKVFLSANNITRLPANIFSNNLKLKEIDVSNNRLTSLPECLYILGELRKLDLRNNNIHTMSAENFNQFSTFLSNKLDNSNVSFRLQLSGNLFSCSCEGSQMIKWLYVYLIPKQKQDPPLQCLLEDNSMYIDNRAMIKSQHLCGRNINLIMTVISSIFPSLCIIAFLILLKKFLKKRRRNMLRQEFITSFQYSNEYLIFLVFCGKEESVIRELIIPTLTDIYRHLLNTNSNKELICAGFDGYRLGLPIIKEMERCIRQSAVVIYLHSKASSKCTRCQREVTMAMDKEKPVAVIVKEQVDKELLSPLHDMCIRKSPSTSLICKDSYLKLDTSDRFCKQILDIAAHDFVLKKANSKTENSDSNLNSNLYTDSLN